MNTAIAETSSSATRCPICGSAESRYHRRGYYIKCSECKVAFREEHESDDELGEYWQSEFWSDEEIEKRKNREPVFRNAFQLLKQYKPETGSVLDIGCGIGTFLHVCRENGWDVTGVEPSTVACEVAKKEYGIELINDLFTSEMFKGKKFDAVFAAQVLHHLPDPVAFLKEIDQVLAEDGVLILRTPNLIPLEMSLYLQRVLGREKEFFLGPALYTFHPDTLNILFKQLNYDNISFVNSRPYLEKPGSPWQAGHSMGANLKRASVAAVKIATHGAVEAVHKLSIGRAIIGPSIFAVAQKTLEADGSLLNQKVA